MLLLFYITIFETLNLKIKSINFLCFEFYLMKNNPSVKFVTAISEISSL